MPDKANSSSRRSSSGQTNHSGGNQWCTASDNDTPSGAPRTLANEIILLVVLKVIALWCKQYCVSARAIMIDWQ